MYKNSATVVVIIKVQKLKGEEIVRKIIIIFIYIIKTLMIMIIIKFSLRPKVLQI